MILIRKQRFHHAIIWIFETASMVGLTSRLILIFNVKANAADFGIGRGEFGDVIQQGGKETSR